MKTVLSYLACLFMVCCSAQAQEDQLLLRLLESPKESNGGNHPKNSIHTKKEKENYRLQYFFNDCSLITREDYGQPGTYSSNIVKLKTGQTYRGTSKGIIMWDNYTIINITTENSHIPQNSITALALDEDDQLWIGTKDAGIVIGYGNPIKPFKTIPVRTRDQHITSIFSDSCGLVWVVYKHGGIECFLQGISCSYFPNQ